MIIYVKMIAAWYEDKYNQDKLKKSVVISILFKFKTLTPSA